MSNSADYNLLIQRYLDHRIDEQELRALGHWIESDPANARRFVKFVSLHRQLGDVHVSRQRLSEQGKSISDVGGPIQDSIAINDALAMLLEAEENAYAPLVVMPDKPKAMPRPYPPRAAEPKPEIYRPLVIPWWVVIATGAAAAAVAIAMIMPFLTPAPQPPPQIVEVPHQTPAQPAWSAFVIGRAHATGNLSKCTYTMGDRINGDIKLGDETVEFQLPSGVTVVAVGPFEGTLTNQRELDLKFGRVVVDVGDAIGGFIVTTDDVVYRDVGTVYGVTLGQDNPGEVAVMQGEVVAEMVLPDGAVARRSVAVGEAARVAEDRSGFEPSEFHEAQYPRTSFAAEHLYRTRLIAESTMAYWRFEPGEVAPGPFAVSDLVARNLNIAVPDTSGNRNHLYHSAPGTGDVRVAAPSDRLNADLAVDRSRSTQSAYFPPGLINEYFDLHTWSAESRPVRGANLDQPNWNEFSIEFSFLAESVEGTATILGLDGEFTFGSGKRPAFAFDLIDGRLRLSGFDSQTRYRQVEPDLMIQPGTWMHVAIVSDGATLRVFIKEDGARGEYRQIGETPFEGRIRYPGPRSWDGFTHTWTLGRGFFDGKMGQPFNGYIDEVRFCRIALNVREFLFAPTAN
ncbi:MAG: LamG-like jellyroll fold domain-containing protein [Phycisphaerales bacterium JB063]